ncbi:MAG: phosphodiester glycosidase family protein [Ruminococcaceae bacterium]|nr:phosphodiester glycosidase family protein [Oscillospiraceae bacterium]
MHNGIKKFFTVLSMIFIPVILTLITAVIVCYMTLALICGSTSPSARKMFVTTVLESGQMKFLASIVLSPEDIQAVVDENSMEAFSEQVDSNLITIKTPETIIEEDSSEGGAEGQKDIEVTPIHGRTFYATMITVSDPSRVSLATIYPWREKGVTLDELVNNNGAVGGINAGLYNSSNNTGGSPYGVVVSNGELQYNEPQQFKGLVLIGLTEDNILQIVDISKMNKKDIKTLVTEKKIRDAVTFQEESSDKNNHFVQLIINGEARDMKGSGSGLNPRTAIGQRADGALLLLVTDGRGASGHLGASASDLIGIMQEYGAVNAANLDGGSSSCMYYEGEYLMPSVTFYTANSSWYLPFGFIIK